MSAEWSPLRNRLSGKHLVVLAAMPDIDRSRTADAIETEEAVISLVRAIVGNGGRVTLIAPSSLALLAAVVAGEFATPQLEESRERPEPAITVVITDTDGLDGAFEHLSTIGYVSARTGDRGKALRDLAGRADALVCAGDGSVEEVEAFQKARSARAPVFALAAPQGGSTELAEVPGVIVADWQVNREAPLFDDIRRDEFDRELEAPPLPPLALAAQWIVERLIGRSSEDDSRTTRGR